jgi:anti-anti-sigma factor
MEHACAAREPVRDGTGARSRPARLELDEELVDGVCALQVRGGDLDLATAAALCSRIDAARRFPDARILLDLTRLSFCDSTGLRALVGAAKEVAISAGRLAIVAPADGPVARLFAVTVATEFLPLHATREDAAAALAGTEDAG